MRLGSLITTGVALAVVAVLGMSGLSNPSTPAGFKSYCVQGGVFTGYKFHSVQQGPTSAGLSWMLTCHPISITPWNHDEEFLGEQALVAKDKLKMEFRMHVKWHVRSDDASIRDYAEHYEVLSEDGNEDATASADQTYANYLEPMVRTLGRQSFEEWNGMEVKDHQGEMGVNMTKAMQTYVKGTPFVIDSITVGSIAPPQDVQDAIAMVQTLKLQMTEKKNQVGIKVQAALRAIEEAKGIEGAMLVVRDSLTPEYLLYLATKILTDAKSATNHSIIYMQQGFPVTGVVPAVQPSK